MTIDVAGVPGRLMEAYERVPIVFDVRSVLVAKRPSADAPFVLSERSVEPYVKDYDAISDRPRDWPVRFDTSRWAMFLAGSVTEPLGGATVAVRTPGLDMLDGRDDLAVLWDIRVAPGQRRHGVGRALFDAAEAWAHGQGCAELKVETQNINVAACRFYASVGCELRTVQENAYPACPGEAQFLWYKRLAVR
jgi:GNAT superfamily N-acetyltransferase